MLDASCCDMIASFWFNDGPFFDVCLTDVTDKRLSLPYLSSDVALVWEFTTGGVVCIELLGVLLAIIGTGCVEREDDDVAVLLLLL